MMISILKDQSGQVGPQFWGRFMQGLAGGLKESERLEQEREQAKQRKAEFGLKEKLLGLQIEKASRAQQEEIKQAAQEQALVDLLTGGVEAPPAIPGVPMRAEAAAPTLSPETTLAVAPPQRREATQKELQAAMIQVQPKEVISQMAKGMFPTGSTGGAAGLTRGFETADEAIAEGQRLGVPGRIEQTSRGWFFRQINPVNVAANRYHEVLAQTGNQSLAMEALRDAVFQQQASAGAGGISGRAGQELGEPIQPMVPFGGPKGVSTPTRSATSAPPQPGPIPGTATPPPPAPTIGPYPTPTGGPSRGTPTQRAAQAKAAATAQGKRQVEAQEKLKDIASTETIIEDLTLLSQKINTGKASDPLGRITKGLQTTGGAWLQTDTDAADLNNLRDSFSLALARSILSERGVLTNQDRSYATNTFPSIWDTQEVAERKIQRLAKLTALQREAEEALAAGTRPFDVQEFRRKWRTPTTDGGVTPLGPIRIDPNIPQAERAEIERRLGLPGSTPTRTLDQQTAVQILKEAGGDRDKARAIARQRGFKF